MLTTGLNLLAELDVSGFLGMFWYTLVIEIPRFTLGLVLVSGYSLIAPQHTRTSLSKEVSVSVLLPGHNEGSALRRAVTALREQTRKNLQLVVVDDGSTDDMAEVGRQLKAEGLLDVFVSTGLRGGKSAATNLGLTFCTGELIIVGDVDTSFDRHAIERVIAPFHDPLVGCVSGNIGVRNYTVSLIATLQAIEYAITISLGRRLSNLLGVVLIASGAFAAFRRAALATVGGWDVGPGEDAGITLKLRRAGWKVRFAPDAWALTDVPDTVTALLRQRRRWNASFVRVRLVRFRGVLDPFQRNFSWLSALGTVDMVFFHAILPVLFLSYVVSTIAYYGPYAFVVFTVVVGFYIATTGFVFMCAAVSDGAYGRISLTPYVIGYVLFRAVFMRVVTIWNYVDELLMANSYRDTFVPSKVQKRKP
jgi:cellulose synthase/poly-beta-1,6-N-acetylglucosamine synthase-like glycosyltransferase